MYLDKKETQLNIKSLKTMSLRNRILISSAAAVAVVGLSAVGVQGAMSYFSDFQQGTIHGEGSVGSIKGSTNTNDLAYTNLLPGDLQTVSAKEVNIGKNAHDVYVVFNNDDALHALNNLGTYGEFHIAANGVQKFDSANLNDNSGGHCGPISPDGCWPVPKVQLLASNVAPGASVDYSFGFAYASKLSGQTAAGGGNWNTYTTGGVTSSGLPYRIVETQVGQLP